MTIARALSGWSTMIGVRLIHHVTGAGEKGKAVVTDTRDFARRQESHMGGYSVGRICSVQTKQS